MAAAAKARVDLVLGLIGHWEPIDVTAAIEPGPYRDDLERFGLPMRLNLVDPNIRMAASIMHEPDDASGEPPLVALVLVKELDAFVGAEAIDGDVVPRRQAVTAEYDWPGGVGKVAFREVTYSVPTGLEYEFEVQFMSPNTYATDELDYLFDLIMASSSLVEVD